MKKIKNWYHNQSIRKKIFYPGLGIILFMSIVFSSVFFIFSSKIMKEEALNNAKTLINTMTTLISIYSRDNKAKNFEKILLSGIAEPAKMKKEILYIAIFNNKKELSLINDNFKYKWDVLKNVKKKKSSNSNSEKEMYKNFVKYHKQNIDIVFNDRITHLYKKKSEIIAYSPVYLKGIFIGILVMGTSTSELDKKIAFTNILLLIFTSLFIFIFIFSFLKISSSLSKPITDLTHAATFLEKEKFEEGLAYLDKLDKFDSSKNEIGILQFNFKNMGERLQEVLRKLENKIELVNKDLQKTLEELEVNHAELQVKQSIIEQELLFAKTIQEKMLPAIPPKKYFDVAAKMYVAASVGGDFYSFIPYKKSLIAAMGDVTGHGIPAALVMVLMRDAFLIHTAKGENKLPKSVLRKMNETAFRELEDGMFTTFFYTYINSEKELMLFGNAGHNCPLLIKNKKDVVLELDTNGFMLGVDDVNLYENKKQKIEKGDIFFLFTDGLTELWSQKTNEDDKRDMLGKEAVVSFLQKNKNLDSQEIIDKLDKMIYEFAGQPPYDDDVTFLCIKMI